MYNINEIKEDFIKVIKYSQNIANPKVDKLFDKWYESKKYFIKAMGGNLWCETDEICTFSLSEEERASRVHSFIDMLEDVYNHYDLAEFILDNIKTFFSNEVSCLPRICENEWYIEHPENNPYKDIKLGMKLIKAFKFFEQDKVVLETIQNEASRLIQEDKIEGKLRVSVHPLDFLSASENTYNWRSCHALDGEYRAGNLSYMCDRSTVMVYLCTEDKKKLPRFPASVPWYSKKWRMLLHFSDNWDMIFAGRQYPFFSMTILDTFTKKLFPKTKMYDATEDKRTYWSKWSNYYVKSVEDNVADEIHDLDQRYVPIAGKLIALKDLVSDGVNSRHYNDIIYSSCYVPYYIKRRARNWGDEYDNVFLPELAFHIGESVYCLCCEEEKILGYGQMGCPKCTEQDPYARDMEHYVTCTCCGATICLEDAYRVNGDEYVCYRCRDKNGYWCPRCNNYYLPTHMKFNITRNKAYCLSCNEDIGYFFDDEEE